MNPDIEPALAGKVERGRAAESIAALWLRLRGLDVLDRNRRAGGGEIDLVARDGRTLVFVEVRLRRAGSWVGAAASVGPQKQARLRSCARDLMRRDEFLWPGRTVRFDVVTLESGPDALVVEHLRAVRLGPALTPRGRRR